MYSNRKQIDSGAVRLLKIRVSPELENWMLSHKEIENLAAFGNEHYYRFDMTPILMVKNSTKNEYRK